MTGMAGELTESRAARLLARMKALYGPAEYDPDRDITVADVVAELAVEPNQARKYLDREVQQQRLVRRQAVIDHRRVNVYREPDADRES